MKRLFAFLLTLVLLFSLTGAGSPILGGDPEPESESGITTDALFTLGTINGDVYENPFIGYGCKFEGWTYADAAYIAQLNNLSGSLMSDDVREQLRKSGTFTEMLATAPDGLASVNIQYQDITVSYGESFAAYPLESFLEMAAPMMPSVLEQSGFKDVKVETGIVSLGGDEHPGLILTSTLSGVSCYQKEACIKTDDYLIFVCVSSFVEDKTEELLACFYPLSESACTETVCFSPKEELDCALRYSNPDWNYEIDEDGVAFFKGSSDEDTCRIVLMAQDIEGMASYSEYLIEIVMNSMESELSEQFDEAVFGEPYDTVVGGKYNGRGMDMEFTLAALDMTMKAYLTAWTTESRLYMLVAYSVPEELDDTLSIYSQLLSSYETADEYLARTDPEALDPAA